MVHQSGIDYRNRQLTQNSRLYIAACEVQLTVGYPGSPHPKSTTSAALSRAKTVK